MSAYPLKFGDSARTMRMRLKTGTAPILDIASAQLRIVGESVAINRPLVAIDANAGRYGYRWTDADFLELGPGNYECEVLATFTDGSKATIPTLESGTIRILPKRT